MSSVFGILPASAIQCKRRRSVCRDRNEPERNVARQFPVPGPGEKSSDRLAPVIPLPPGRHTEDCILPKQSDKAVEIGTLPSPDVPLEQRALAMVRRRVGAGPTGRESVRKRGAGALQGAAFPAGTLLARLFPKALNQLSTAFPIRLICFTLVSALPV